jgi:hypothetical protein
MLGRLLALGILLACLSARNGAAARATATGRVLDITGKPVEHATVLVYEAHIRKGFSVYCPSGELFGPKDVPPASAFRSHAALSGRCGLTS